MGLLASAVLVQFGPHPLTLPFVVLLGLLGAAFVGVYFMPEPVTDRSGLRLKLERPQVPASVRGPFAVAALAVLASWSIGGLSLSLGPQLGGTLFGSPNLVVATSGVVVLTLVAAISQLPGSRMPAWLGASAGSVSLAIGVLLIVTAAATGSIAIYLVGSIIGGAGFGIAFLGGLRGLTVAIPPEHRAAVISAFYVVAYASLSVPAVLAGVVTGHAGLQGTFEIFGTSAAVIALAVAALAVRLRPAS
jgi:hypothetical protein